MTVACFYPEQLPVFELADFDSADSPARVAEVLLRPFFEGSALVDALRRNPVRDLQFPDPVDASPG